MICKSFLKGLLCLLFFQSAFGQTAQIDSLSQLLTKTEDPLRQSYLLEEIGHAYLSEQLDSSKVFFTRAKKLNSPVVDSLARNIALGMFTYHLYKRQYDSARVYLDTVRGYNYLSAPYKQSYFRNSGFLEIYQGNFDASRTAFKSALAIADSLGDTASMQGFANNAAIGAQQLGDYQDAIAMSQIALEIAAQAGDVRSRSKSLNNIGMLFEKLEDYDKAKSYLEQSLAIDDSLNDKESLVGDYLNLGIITRKQGVSLDDRNQLLIARELYLKALSISDSIGYPKGLTGAYTNLAILENTLENYDQALTYGTQAVQYSEAQNDIVGLMIANINLGESYRATNAFAKAEDALNTAIAIAKRIGFKQAEQEANLSMSKLYKSQGDFRRAFDYLEEYTTVKDSIGSVEVKNKVNELEKKYQTAEKEKNLQAARATLAEKTIEIRRKNVWMYGLAAAALLVGIIGYLLYNRQQLKNNQQRKEFELQQALVKVETQNKLQEQRLRISRDLHDNIGSQLTFITSSLDTIKYGLSEEQQHLSDRLATIGDFTKNTINELRDTIWAMNKEAITIGDLQGRIAHLMTQATTAYPNTAFDVKIAEALPANYVFTAVEGVHIYRIIQEAVNNALKHASADTIGIFFDKKDQLEIQIVDNGSGFEEAEVDQGNGLKNMKKRAQDINGVLEINSESNGSIVKLTLPMT
mgnify:CR=1 FL=1